MRGSGRCPGRSRQLFSTRREPRAGIAVVSSQQEEHPRNRTTSVPLFVCLCKCMCQAEIFGNQTSAWLILCCINRDQVPGTSERSPESVTAFATMSFSFLPTVLSPAHPEVAVQGHVPWLWEEHEQGHAGPSLCLLWPSFLTCANQNEHPVKIIFAIWSPKVPMVPCWKPQAWIRTYWWEILHIKAVCVFNSGGQAFVPRGCTSLYDSLVLEWSLYSHTASSFFHL